MARGASCWSTPGPHRPATPDGLVTTVAWDLGSARGDGRPACLRPRGLRLLLGRSDPVAARRARADRPRRRDGPVGRVRARRGRAGDGAGLHRPGQPLVGPPGAGHDRRHHPRRRARPARPCRRGGDGLPGPRDGRRHGGGYGTSCVGPAGRRGRGRDGPPAPTPGGPGAGAGCAAPLGGIDGDGSGDAGGARRGCLGVVRATCPSSGASTSSWSRRWRRRGRTRSTAPGCVRSSGRGSGRRNENGD